MSKSVYIISPAPALPQYFGMEVFSDLGLLPAQTFGILATVTVAALVPDGFVVRLCDEALEPVDLAVDADFIGITGNYAHARRMIALAEDFRKRGKTVMMGGPLATLCSDFLRPHCDILVRGEIEEIAGALFADLRQGRWRDEYVGGHPDLSLSPTPRWDLYTHHHRILSGTLQTSRGCPFGCEFCDVHEYLGRRQRHKSVAQVLRELDVLYRLGHRRVMLADDNLTASRGRAKELMAAFRDWNCRQPDGPVQFSMQASIDAAKDEELLDLCQQAGVSYAFIGVETPNQTALIESHKLQNTGVDLVEQVHRFIRRGIGVACGLMMGFDADGPGIFEDLLRFADASAVPWFTINALKAPIATSLYRRLQMEGQRMIDCAVGEMMNPFDTNVVPKQMTRDELLLGLRWLVNRIFAPQAFEARALDFIAMFGEESAPGRLSGEHLSRSSQGAVFLDLAKVVRSIAHLGPGEAQMLSRVLSASARKPEAGAAVASQLFEYRRMRYLLSVAGIWDPALSKMERPPFRNGH